MILPHPSEDQRLMRRRDHVSEAQAVLAIEQAVQALASWRLGGGAGACREVILALNRAIGLCHTPGVPLRSGVCVADSGRDGGRLSRAHSLLQMAGRAARQGRHCVADLVAARTILEGCVPA